MFLQSLDMFAEIYLNIERWLFGIHGNIIEGDKTRPEWFFRVLPAHLILHYSGDGLKVAGGWEVFLLKYVV